MKITIKLDQADVKRLIQLSLNKKVPLAETAALFLKKALLEAVPKKEHINKYGKST